MSGEIIIGIRHKDSMEEYLKKAGECLEKADQENDISERYSLLRKAEIYVRMAEVNTRERANAIAGRHVSAMQLIGGHLDRLQNWVRQK